MLSLLLKATAVLLAPAVHPAAQSPSYKSLQEPAECSNQSLFHVECSGLSYKSSNILLVLCVSSNVSPGFSISLLSHRSSQEWLLRRKNNHRQAVESGTSSSKETGKGSYERL